MRENDYHHNIIIIHCVASYIAPTSLLNIIAIIDLITHISSDEENFHVNY